MRANDRIDDIERLAARAWPAERVREVGGWRLRFSGGAYRRLNSVSATACTREPAFARRLELVEAFYAERGIPARFQLGAVSAPADLDARLAERGYATEAPTRVETAPLAEVLRRCAPRGGFELDVAEAFDPRWTGLVWPAGGDRREEGVRTLRRIEARTGYALARAAGEPIAAGLGVAEAGHLGVFAMVTRPDIRGQGAGRAVLRALADWGGHCGVHTAYLQVEEDNAAARGLYRSAGFATLTHYHYRTQPEPEARADPTPEPGRS